MYVIFRTLKGEVLFEKTLHEHKEIEATLKLDIGRVVTLNGREYRIVGNSFDGAAPNLFEQKDWIMKYGFTVEAI